MSFLNTYTDARARRYALVLLTIVYSFNFVDRQLLAILQESIKADLSLTDSQLGLLTGFAFAVFYVTAGIPIARWADRGNRRNILAISLFIWSGMTAVSGLVANFGQLLVARIGVGIGEAGGSPPSHSIISDIFPPDRRASALGFYSMGVNIGILFGFLLGGWLNAYFGWRAAFFVVGLPGIALAMVLLLTLREPLRGVHEPASAETGPSDFFTVLKYLCARRTFVFMALAAALNAFCSNAIASWIASFMIRSYSMPTAELGSWLAAIIGLGGAVSVVMGGVVADVLAKRDVRWYMWVPAVSGLIAVPFVVAIFSVQSAYASLAMLVVPGLMFQVFLGTTIATTHAIVAPNMRATSSAVLLLVMNFIGLGGGPWAVGFVSDQLAADLGTNSLRYAMLYLLPPVMALSAFLFWRAARYLESDMNAAQQLGR